jgi:hypothetical protein
LLRSPPDRRDLARSLLPGVHPSRLAPSIGAFVKLRSRISFAAFTIAALSLAPSAAWAETVELFPVGGTAEGSTLTMAASHIRQTITALGHTVVEGSGTRPTTAAEFTAAASSSNAVYVVIADIEPHPGHYGLHVWVGSVDAQRVEELMVDVLYDDEDARLRDVLGSMLRPQGLADDALRLSAEETDAERARRLAAEEAARQAEAERQRQADADAAAAAEAQRRADEAEAARVADEERQRREQAEREAAEAAQHTWENRPLYGAGGAWMVQIGGAGGGAIQYANHNPHVPDGGALGLVQARIGRTIDGTGGLELRGGADVFFGLGAGLDLMIGATYQFTPFVEPIHIGAIAELGLSIAFQGPRDVGFVFRAGAVVSWNPVDHLYFELALPELGVMTNGTGELVFGGALRIGYRFD